MGVTAELTGGVIATPDVLTAGATTATMVLHTTMDATGITETAPSALEYGGIDALQSRRLAGGTSACSWLRVRYDGYGPFPAMGRDGFLLQG